MTSKLIAIACLLVTALWSGVASEGGIFVLAQAPDTTAASQAGDPARIDGDVARGQALFESKGACLGCHRIGARGSRFGPDLSDIGARGRGDASDLAAPGRARAELARALLDPGADILPANRTVRLLTRGGEPITARVLNQDTFSMQLIDTKERVFSIPKSELREFAWIKSSSMPSYRDKLTPQELADLIAYLVSLKGINK